MRKLPLLAVSLLLVAAGSAGADHLEPEKRIRAADQKRASAMLLRQSDLPGFVRQPSPGPDPHLTCRALDESDLTVTGDAETPTWTAAVVFVASSSTVYATLQDASTAWKRGTSAAGVRCLRIEQSREYRKQGLEIVSFRKLSFPALARRAAAFRLSMTAQASGRTIAAYVDIVVLMEGRALAGLVVAYVATAPDRAVDIRLARILAARMKAAMRGA